MATNNIIKIKTTNKSHKQLIIHNYRYYLHTLNTNGSKYWLCSEKGCKSSLTIQNELVLKVDGIARNPDDSIEDLLKASHVHDSLSSFSRSN